ncbi:MAG: TIGR03032 family protein [Alphaproteobacteria bacterium]|nr:TIGR03032 family protein [Alphaproteobacteria bacterium]
MGKEHGYQIEGKGASAAAQKKSPAVGIACSRGLPSWLRRNNVSLAFTSYQSGRLYLVGISEEDKLAFHERFFARAMGLYADEQRLVLATAYQVWRLENTLAIGGEHEGHDRYFVPRTAHTTGDIDIHELALLDDERIVFVNTMYSCLATLSKTHSFRPFWKPPFISKLAAEDRCHLNGLAMRDGKPSHVTAASKSDAVYGWRDRRDEGGCVIDVAANEVVTEQLSMPHSPRWYKNELWVLNSGTGYLCVIDTSTGKSDPRVFCPGFLRGLAFHNGHAIVGLSRPRDGTFSGLQLDDELKRRDAEPRCGVHIINLASGDVVNWIEFTGGVAELFDVQVLPGVRRPMAAGILNDEIHHFITVEPE